MPPKTVQFSYSPFSAASTFCQPVFTPPSLNCLADTRPRQAFLQPLRNLTVTEVFNQSNHAKAKRRNLIGGSRSYAKFQKLVPK